MRYPSATEPDSIRNRRPGAIPVLLALLLLSVGPAGLRAQPRELRGFDAYVRQAVADWEVPGLAIAVVKDGEVVFAHGYGVRALGRPEPVTPRTLFAIGSTTKAMTAAAIGMLVGEGKIGWDDPVTRHLPWFELADPYVTRELTVRDLLTHRAGLGNADFLWYGQENTREEILRRMRYLEPAYSLRAGYVYQNLMYAAAGAVVEAASGMPWAEFIRTRIFAPLGMTGSIPTMATLSEQPDVASPHDRVDGVMQVIGNASVDAVAPAGSVWSSVEDMAKWIVMLLDGGEAPDGTRLLEPAILAELFSPQTIIPRASFYPTARLTRPHWTTYALGWFQADYGGRAVDFHTGSIDGMVAICGLIRDENLGVYVLANRDHAELRHALMYRVFDLYGGDEARDWSAEFKELYDEQDARSAERARQQEDERVAGTSPSLEPDRYAGTYTDRLFGTVEVTARDGGLFLTYGPGLRGPLEHWHYDTFRVRFEAAWRGTALVTFQLDMRGEPEGLEMNGSVFHRERR